MEKAGNRDGSKDRLKVWIRGGGGGGGVGFLQILSSQIENRMDLQNLEGKPFNSNKNEVPECVGIN
jgi:hypothetical protein